MDALPANTATLLAGLPRRISDIPALVAARAPGDPALREDDRAWTFA